MTQVKHVEVVARRTVLKFVIAGFGSVVVAACGDDDEESGPTTTSGGQESPSSTTTPRTSASSATAQTTATTVVDNELLAFVIGSWNVRQELTSGPGGVPTDDADVDAASVVVEVGDGRWEVFDPGDPELRYSGSWSFRDSTIRVTGDESEQPSVAKRLPDEVEAGNTYRFTSGYANDRDEHPARVVATVREDRVSFDVRGGLGDRYRIDARRRG